MLVHYLNKEPKEMSLKSVKSQLLRAISKHDGEWGWYQLDRVVNPRDLPDGFNVMLVLTVLEQDGLVRQVPAETQARYALTDKGCEEVIVQ